MSQSLLPPHNFMSVSGNSSVMVGIWGPVDIRQSREDPERCVIETSVKAATGHGSPLDTMLEEALRLTCEQMVIVTAHPRTSIQVVMYYKMPGKSSQTVVLLLFHTR